MIIAVILAILLGICAGVVTGLIPGIHINLVSVLVVSLSALVSISPIYLAVFIISMAVTHTFLDAIPSIFLGAPDPDMAMAALPGHVLLLEGKGYEAVKLTAIGSLLCLIFGFILFPLLLFVFPLVYKFIKNYIGWILLAIVIFMLAKDRKIFANLFVFLLSGTMGMIILTSDIENPLLPMFSGLFGISILLTSLNQNTSVPKQRTTDSIIVDKKDLLKSVTAGTFSGGLTSLFPGLGAAQAAVLASAFFKKISSYSYLIVVGGINTVNFLLSLVTFYTLTKARNGGVIAVMEIIGKINFPQLLLLLSSALIVGGVATFLALKLSRIFCRIIEKVDYRRLTIGVILFITAIVAILTGPLGLLILAISAAVGLIPNLMGINKSHAMGCLLVPVIMFFLL